MHAAPTIPTLVDLLLAKFDGRLVIPFPVAVEVIGYNQQTARNELVRGVFPVPTMLQGSRRFIAVVDLAGYLEQLYASRNLPPPPKKKLGRPTKVEQVAARQGASCQL